MCIRDRSYSLNRSSPKSIGTINSTLPVSYTHLDVYKRQDMFLTFYICSDVMLFSERAIVMEKINDLSQECIKLGLK